MKKFLVATIFIFSLGASAGPSKCDNGNFYKNLLPTDIKFDQELCYSSFNVLYSYKTKSPVIVGEYLTAERLLQGYHVKRSNDFYAEVSIPLPYRATEKDYKKSGFDKGHQAPAADAFDDLSKDETFVMSNMVPQTPDLNRRTWRLIEEDVRDKVIQKNLSAYVLTGPIYNDTVLNIGHGVWVPAYSYKAVSFSDGSKVVYVATNVRKDSKSFAYSEEEFLENFKFNPFRQE